MTPTDGSIDGLAELQALTKFDVDMHFAARETTFDVIAAGQSTPVARLSDDGMWEFAPMQVLTGPDLATVAGLVTPTAALLPDFTPIGAINLYPAKIADEDVRRSPSKMPREFSKARSSPKEWRILPQGRPPLTGAAKGIASRVGSGKLAGFVRDQQSFGIDLAMDLSIWEARKAAGWATYLVPFKFTFSGDGSEGFTVKRPAGKMRLSLVVHDPELDRRLILACVFALSEYSMDSVSKSFVDTTSVFTRRRKSKSRNGEL